MKIKLIDIKTNSYETTTGTCDLCMRIEYVEEPTFYFEKSDGTQFEIKGYYWEWGTLLSIYVENVIELADYFNHQKYDRETTFNYYWLYCEVEKFHEEYLLKKRGR